MNKPRAIRLTEFGGPEVMLLEPVALDAPGPGQVRLCQTAVGFNYIDVYQRSGKYPLPTPTGLGHEAAGVVEAVGPGVTDLFVGDRVVYMNAGIGAYATHRVVAADRMVKLPADVPDDMAAGMFFKAMTAQYLVKRTHAVRPGDVVLVHAAAGGVGQILASWARTLGATVVGTVGSEAKRDAATVAGCHAVVNYAQPDWVRQVLDATEGRKPCVVYDSVGQHTFMGSLDCAAAFGIVVLYGAASGPVAPFDPELLNRKGCLFLTRPSVFPHNADTTVLRANAADVFSAFSTGAIRPEIGARFGLEEAAHAHRAAEGRRLTGSIVMLP